MKTSTAAPANNLGSANPAGVTPTGEASGAGAPPAPSSPSPASLAAKKFCPNCGTANDANAKFCSKCGAKLD
jgi:membrane protease subunit (stomatin/prohibitin family)